MDILTKKTIDSFNDAITRLNHKQYKSGDSEFDNAIEKFNDVLNQNNLTWFAKGKNKGVYHVTFVIGRNTKCYYGEGDNYENAIRICLIELQQELNNKN